MTWLWKTLISFGLSFLRDTVKGGIALVKQEALEAKASKADAYEEYIKADQLKDRLEERLEAAAAEPKPTFSRELWNKTREHENNASKIINSGTKLLLVVLAVGLCSCSGKTRTVYTPLPRIPVKPLPELTGDDTKDLGLVGSYALDLRQLVKQYNTMARRVNEQHGLEKTDFRPLSLE